MILITDIIKDMEKSIPASEIKLPTAKELLQLQKKYHSKPNESMYDDGEHSTWDADEVSTWGGNSIFSGLTVDSSMTGATSASLALLNAPIQSPPDGQVEKPDQPTPGKPYKPSGQLTLEGVTKTSNQPPLSEPSSKPVPAQSLSISGPARSGTSFASSSSSIPWRDIGPVPVPKGKRKTKAIMWVCVCIPTFFSWLSVGHT